jgi:hypothetical protein
VEAESKVKLIPEGLVNGAPEEGDICRGYAAPASVVAAALRAASRVVTARLVAAAALVVEAGLVGSSVLVMQVMELKVALVIVQVELPKLMAMSAGLELKPAVQPCTAHSMSGLLDWEQQHLSSTVRSMNERARNWGW